MSENHDHLDKYLQQLLDDSRTTENERSLIADRRRRPATELGVRPLELFHFPEEPRHGAGEDDKQLSAEGDERITLLTEGLALNKAFSRIKTARLRKAIVDLVLEYEKVEVAN